MSKAYDDSLAAVLKIFPNTNNTLAYGTVFVVSVWNAAWISTAAGFSTAFAGPNGAIAIVLAKLMAFAYTGSFLAAFNSVDLLTRAILDVAAVSVHGRKTAHRFPFRVGSVLIELFGIVFGVFGIMGLWRAVFGLTTFRRFVARLFIFHPGTISNSNLVVPISTSIIFFFLAYGYTGITFLLQHADPNRHNEVFGVHNSAVAMAGLTFIQYVVFSYIQEPLYTLAVGLYSDGTWPGVAVAAGARFRGNAANLWAYILVPYVASPLSAIVVFYVFNIFHDAVSNKFVERNSDLSEYDDAETNKPNNQNTQGASSQNRRVPNAALLGF